MYCSLVFTLSVTEIQLCKVNALFRWIRTITRERPVSILRRHEYSTTSCKITEPHLQGTVALLSRDSNILTVSFVVLELRFVTCCSLEIESWGDGSGTDDDVG